MTGTTPRVLDPLDFPLKGSRLIEASAGTGKTFTIAALYLRLVLGHGGTAGFGRSLNPPEILVVTFTDAATQELRGRIRDRLAQAARCFESADDDATLGFDALLLNLRQAYPPAQWVDCAARLRLAAEWMDEAAVSTIHGWCKRMLSEHAFDSGSLFTQALEPDTGPMLAEAVRDHWRAHFTPITREQAGQVQGLWSGPDALLKAIERPMAWRDDVPPGLPPAQAFHTAAQEAARLVAELQGPWAGDGGWAVELASMLDHAVKSKWLEMRARKNWTDKLRQWAELPATDPMAARGPQLTDTAWQRLARPALEADLQGRAPAGWLEHPGWQALAGLRPALAGLPDPGFDMLCHAVHDVAARFEAEQQRRALMGFDSLLTRFEAALHGPNGTRLAEQVRRQFPVALIDEFQDTDPVQYRIFDAVYRVRDNADETALVLIGDPKQAIYSFRGADIHTYLVARRDTAGRLDTLGTNFRSSPAMVEAVNRLFAHGEDTGGGAFGFRQDGDNPVPFLPVQAHGRRAQWIDRTTQGDASPALVCWTFDPDRATTSDALRRRVADACATEVVRLLRAGQSGQAGFLDDRGDWQPVAPGDLAVLVHSGIEAEAVRQALRARGVRSVYLSDRESVFRSTVTADVQRWLQACAEPDDDRRLRAALATATLDLDWTELDRLNHDELAWEARVLQFRDYRLVWQRQGVLPMLRRLVHDFSVAQHLLAVGNERALTDLLHLSELLQEASVTLDGEHALVRWLAEQRAEDARSSGEDGRRLRLESEASLVTVVTVHKSKGLEYPLVFLPFGTHTRRVAPKTNEPLRWRDDSGHWHVQARPSTEAIAAADGERLKEDLRKLYVALTRARHVTWVGLVPDKAIGHSALAHLLGLQPDDGYEALVDAADRLGARPAAGGDAVMALIAAPENDGLVYTDHTPPAPQRPEPPRREQPHAPWWIASYSALRVETLASPDGAAATRNATEERFVQAWQEGQVADVAPTEPASLTLHTFDRGAGPGTFLHQLLEWAGRRGFARLASDAAARQDLDDLVARRCNLRGWSRWTELLQHWLGAWVGTPLSLGSLAPGEERVAPSGWRHYQVEMEFWLPVQGVDAQAVDAAVCEYLLPGMVRPMLAPLQLQGLFKGFIDLVFEHEGRYFVLDHKSNWLGPDDSHYHPDALADAVLSHRLELQYALYTLALHRLLRSRLPDYDYDRHVGGALVLFLRGHAAPGQGVHATRPPRALIERLDALFGANPMEASA
ncbi:MAG: exodeoxyribonuclease V subunit beta [Burkholderiaceae bacterium]